MISMGSIIRLDSNSTIGTELELHGSKLMP